MSKKQKWGILFIYFGIYVIGADILVYLLNHLTKSLNTSTQSNINFVVTTIIYILIFVSVVYLGRSELKNAFKDIKENFIDYFGEILKILGFMFLCNAICSIAFEFIFNLSGAANETSVNNAISEMPLYYALLTCIFAPIVEETVFRGVIFKSLREKGFVYATVISSVLFGFIHVFSSLLEGNFIDCIYIIQYALMGYWLSRAVEKTNSIGASIMLHFLNNLIATLSTIILSLLGSMFLFK